jgi:hypothetical protein
MIKVLYVLFFLCLNSYFAITVTEVYHLYKIYSLRQKEGLWLHTQCQEPEFLQKLSLHSDACLQMDALYQKSALAFALEDFLKQKSFSLFLSMLWDAQAIVWAIISALVFFILIPPYLSIMEKRERNRLTLAVHPTRHTHCKHV